MKMETVFSYLYAICSIAMIIALIYVLNKQKKWGEPLFVLKKSKNKLNRIAKYLYYALLVITVPSFIYENIIHRSTDELFKNFFFLVMSVYFICIFTDGLKIYEKGIYLTGKFFEWKEINNYKIDDDTLQLNIKNKYIDYFIGEDKKDKLENILEEKIS